MDLSSSKSDPLLLFKLKELELQIKQQEHENRRLHLRELEMIHVEKGKEGSMRELLFHLLQFLCM